MLAAELLDRILAQPSDFLETLSLKLLRAMGYGGREALLEHTSKPGDSGLDGLVRQDALGLDLVGVQAKRYDKDNVVQRPDIQAFVGALQGAQTNRGVFVTTGRFSAGARQFAENIPMRLRLIDGKELTNLLVRYNVGVQVSETGSPVRSRRASWRSFSRAAERRFSSASRSARKLWRLQTVAELGLGARHRPSNHVNVTIWKRCGAVRVVFHIGSAQIESVVRHDFGTAMRFGCTS